MSGLLWALASETGWSLTKIFHRHGSELLGRGTKEACESSLRWIVDEMTERKQGPFLVKVYMLGGDRDNPLFGLWSGYSETEKEISLRQLDICEADPYLNKLLALQPRNCWINHESGVVVEFLVWNEEQQEAFKQHMYNIYQNKVTAWEVREEKDVTLRP